MFPSEALERLGKPLDPKRVVTFEQGPQRGSRYLEHEDVVRTANDIFGFGNWGFQVDGLPKLIEGGKYGQDGDKLYEVWGVRGVLTLSGGLEFADVGTCVRSGTGPFGLEMAFKGAASDALKRCLRHLGDQFGLVLYDKDRRALDAAWRDEAAPGAQGEGANLPSSQPQRPPVTRNRPDYPWKASLRAALVDAAMTVKDLSPVLGELTPENADGVINEWFEAHAGRTVKQLIAEAQQVGVGA